MFDEARPMTENELNRRKARLLWELAGKLSTMNFSDKHPEEAYSWLVENSDELKEGLDSVPNIPKGC